MREAAGRGVSVGNFRNPGVGLVWGIQGKYKGNGICDRSQIPKIMGLEGWQCRERKLVEAECGEDMNMIG